MDSLKRFQKALDHHLSLRSQPVAIKFLEVGESVPPGMSRPFRDTKERIRPCVGWHLARHNGFSVTMLKDDFASACPSGVFVFGLEEPLKEWFDGDLAYGVYVNTRKAARSMERHVHRLETGKYQGVAFAPLAKTTFNPDLVMVFCDSKDLRKLVLGTSFTTGVPLNCSMYARDLCSEGVIQPFLAGSPVVAVPCGGDRRYGATMDDEMVFTTPVDRLDTIVDGIEYNQKATLGRKLGDVSPQQIAYGSMARTLEARMRPK